MKQYEMIEFSFQGHVPKGSNVTVDLTAKFSCDDESIEVKGFYAGNGVYKVRFLPEKEGIYTYCVSGCIAAEGTLEVGPAGSIHHGIVKADGTRFVHADGTVYHPFGTTVYALTHQPEELLNETMSSLRKAPFNKVRLCVFPKHYDYNKNDPQYYPFEKDAEGKWDVHHPCLTYWDALELRLRELADMQIQADLILFHPYDRWGFSSMTLEEDKAYLDYLLRRLSAFPNLWWSLANEYDLASKSVDHWERLECFVAENDPHHHLLSCHNAFKFWDFTRPNITHVSIQTKMLQKANGWRNRYGKPVMVDECGYEGNLPHTWGSISGKEMTARFWRTVVTGAYCTHGETFLDKEDIIWWAKGGSLKGESVARIAFLREIIESLPGHLEGTGSQFEKMMKVPPQMREMMASRLGDRKTFVTAFWRLEDEMESYAESEMTYQGQIGDRCYLTYYDLRTCAQDTLRLPEDKTYRVELIDTWNMTREVIAVNARGSVLLQLPGREYMAVLAIVNK